MNGLVLGGGLLVDYKRSGAFLPGSKVLGTQTGRETPSSQVKELSI